MSTALLEAPAPTLASPHPLPVNTFELSFDDSISPARREDFGQIDIEGILVDEFPTTEKMFDRLVADIKGPAKAKIFSINVHGANIANADTRFKSIMQNAETMICDGMGIMMGSKLLPGQNISCRHAAGDFMPALLQRLAAEKLTAYFLAGKPGVAEAALCELAKKVPNHTVLGCHHGYILNDKHLETQVINEINALKPDILFVGFGMPLQEFWIEEKQDLLKVRAFFPFGATLDYLSNTVQRCPTWIGNLGLEWLFRLSLEPQRMFERYVMGNPAFVYRLLKTLASKNTASRKATVAVAPTTNSSPVIELNALKSNYSESVVGLSQTTH